MKVRSYLPLVAQGLLVGYILLNVLVGAVWLSNMDASTSYWQLKLVLVLTVMAIFLFLLTKNTRCSTSFWATWWLFLVIDVLTGLLLVVLNLPSTAHPGLFRPE